MEYASINYLAVAVAGVAYMILGAVWYSPALFGNSWMKAIGKTKEQVAADFSPMNYGWAILTAIVASYGIARIMIWTGGDSIVDGIMVALACGVCFILAPMIVNDVFENRPRGLTMMNVLYHMIGLIIAGVIVGAWR